MKAAKSESFRSAEEIARGWRQKFRDTNRKGLFDIVTSIFLDCHDDEIVAKELSAHFNVPMTRSEVSEIRIAASHEARISDDPDLKRRWCFRFGVLSENNMAREYMLLENCESFMEAKMALADEIAAFSRELPVHQLWIVINEAFGRNNISLDLIKYYEEYAVHLSRIRDLILAAKWREDQKRMHTRIEILAQMIKLTAVGREKVSAKGALRACEILSAPNDALDKSDVEFLLEFNHDASIPNTLNEADLLQFDRETHVHLLKAINQENPLPVDINTLEMEQIDELKELLLSRSMILPSDLEQMHKDAKLRAAKQSVFTDLADMLANLVTCASADNFFTKSEKKSAQSKGVSQVELYNIITDLNSLPAKDEAESYIKELLKESEKESVLAHPLDRYMSMRWLTSKK